MSKQVKVKLLHLTVVVGLMLAFMSAPTPPSLNGDCSVQTSTCTG